MAKSPYRPHSNAVTDDFGGRMQNKTLKRAEFTLSLQQL
jgi:hypothetical protein